MRISDWSSDVCSSDLPVRPAAADPAEPCMSSRHSRARLPCHPVLGSARAYTANGFTASFPTLRSDRKSVVLGKSVSVRLDLGGRVIIKTITLSYRQRVS